MAKRSAQEQELRNVKRILEYALHDVKHEMQHVRASVTHDTKTAQPESAAASKTDGEAPAQNAQSVNTEVAQSADVTETVPAETAVALPTTSVVTANDATPTVLIPLGSVAHTSITAEEEGGSCPVPEPTRVRRRVRRRTKADLFGDIKNMARGSITGLFSFWLNISTTLAKMLNWYPCVKPYVGYGTEEFSRLICRTLYAPHNARIDRPERGIREMLQVPAPHQRVYINIDNVPLKTVQIGEMEIYDPVDPAKNKTANYSVSDSCGYLDLLAEHKLAPGTHTCTVRVKHRPPVDAPLYIIPDDCPVGIISDVDDTIMVTQVPTVWKAAYNMLFLSPHKRASVPGMSVLYTKVRDLFPDAPFFYLSTSPWNVEQQIRGFIRDYGFPDGPMLLRDLDPRPKRFVPSGVDHKLEYAEQLMEDFPNMKFILFGDDGQKDPTTYATIAKRYPGRVLAIGIRQLSAREATGGIVGSLSGLSLSHPMPEVDVPVFTGNTGTNIMKTMLPYLKQFAEEEAARGTSATR